MEERIAIVGVGYTPFRPISPDLSFREMIFEAAQKAYEDAGIIPKDVDTFVSIAEDFLEGTAIFDEYVPDQLGAVLKPVHTICSDGISGLGSLFLQLKTGRFRIGVIEGHSKASNIVHETHIDALALDPVTVRPLRFSPKFVAGMEMMRFIEETENTELHSALVVEKNKYNALKNPLAAFPAQISVDDVMDSKPIASPLKELDIAPYADGAIVMVVATESIARRLTDKPIFIEGIGWAQDTPNLEVRDWARANYLELAAGMAFGMAGIRDPRAELDFAEVDDTFSYKELQHLEALGIAREGEAGKLLEEGFFDLDGPFPVNPSGGNLGCGYTYDLSGLRSILEAVLQLRQEAGMRQIEDVGLGLAAAWRGIPTASGAVAILSNE